MTWLSMSSDYLNYPTVICDCAFWISFLITVSIFSVGVRIEGKNQGK